MSQCMPTGTLFTSCFLAFNVFHLGELYTHIVVVRGSEQQPDPETTLQAFMRDVTMLLKFPEQDFPLRMRTLVTGIPECKKNALYCKFRIKMSFDVLPSPTEDDTGRLLSQLFQLAIRLGIAVRPVWCMHRRRCRMHRRRAHRNHRSANRN